MIFRLVYASRVSPTAALRLPETVSDVLASSQRNNALLKVSGLLLVHQGWFLQALEGGENVVRVLYRRIAEDRRHSECTVLASENAPERLFGQWSMCARNLSPTDEAIVKTLALRGDFDARRLGAKPAVALLKAVRDIQDRRAA